VNLYEIKDLIQKALQSRFYFIANFVAKHINLQSILGFLQTKACSVSGTLGFLVRITRPPCLGQADAHQTVSVFTFF